MTSYLTPAQLASLDRDIAGAYEWRMKLLTEIREALDEGDDPTLTILRVKDRLQNGATSMPNLAAHFAATLVWIAQYVENKS